MLSPWIIPTLFLPPLLASLIPRTFRRYHTPTIYLPQNSRLPTYHRISIAIPRYIAMQLTTVSFTMTRFIIVIIALRDHVVDIVFVAKTPFIILHTCHSCIIAYPGTPPEAFT